MQKVRLRVSVARSNLSSGSRSLGGLCRGLVMGSQRSFSRCRDENAKRGVPIAKCGNLEPGFFVSGWFSFQVETARVNKVLLLLFLKKLPLTAIAIT